MKTLLATLTVSLFLHCAARADVEVSSSPDQVWIATDAQMAKLKPLAPGQKPSGVNEAKLKRDALAFAKKQTGIRDWEAPGCELIEIDALPGKYIWMITLIRPEIKTAADGMIVIALQDGTIIEPKAK